VKGKIKSYQPLATSHGLPGLPQSPEANAEESGKMKEEKLWAASDISKAE
jgi:hypothetical protein